jgi:hypothetical protein
MKIKSFKQLNAEKKRLSQEKTNLEQAIRNDWKDIQHSLNPKNLAAGIFSKTCDQHTSSTNGSDSLSDKISRIAAGFTRKIVETAEEKAYKWFRKK